MWPKTYRDYKTDAPLVKDQVEPSRGIIGCEMHEINGWGNTVHIPKGKKAEHVPTRREFAPKETNEG